MQEMALDIVSSHPLLKLPIEGATKKYIDQYHLRFTAYSLFTPSNYVRHEN